jgi:predicted membrane GTPase involved in stress response
MMHDCFFKELNRNVSPQVTKTDPFNSYEVSGCGHLHLTVLIEMMHREGFKLEVGPPTVIYKWNEELGKIEEPLMIAEICVTEKGSVALWTCSTHTRESCKTWELKTGQCGQAKTFDKREISKEWNHCWIDCSSQIFARCMC